MRNDNRLLDEAAKLQTGGDDLANTLGLRLVENEGSEVVGRRVDELSAVFDAVADRLPDRADAYRWFRDDPLAGFGGHTAADLVRSGHVSWALNAIAAIDAGVHA